MGKKDNRYFMSAVKLGPKGQIVIPKQARELFVRSGSYGLRVSRRRWQFETGQAVYGSYG